MIDVRLSDCLVNRALIDRLDFCINYSNLAVYALLFGVMPTLVVKEMNRVDQLVQERGSKLDFDETRVLIKRINLRFSDDVISERGSWN